MQQEQMPPSNKPSLEDILKGLGGKTEFNDKLSYLLEALKKYEGLGDKLNIINRVPRAKEGTEIRTKAAQEVLKGMLGKQKFSDLYSICHLGSKEKNPDGYHLIYTGKEPAPISPEHFPIDLVIDLLEGRPVLVQCHYHLVGLSTGAIGRNKPYEVLSFNPSRELQQIIESATQEYKIVIRQNHRRNYNIKPEDDVMVAVIFENETLYADPSKREEVINYLEKAERSIQLFKEGQITRENLATIIKSGLKTVTFKQYVYSLPMRLEHIDFIGEINETAEHYGQGYRVVVLSAKDGSAGMQFYEEPTEEKLKHTIEDVRWQMNRIKKLIDLGVASEQLRGLLHEEYQKRPQQ